MTKLTNFFQKVFKNEKRFFCFWKVSFEKSVLAEGDWWEAAILRGEHSTVLVYSPYFYYCSGTSFFSSTLLVPGRCCFQQWLAPGAQADAVLDNGLLRVRKPMLLPAGAELWSYVR